MVDVLILAGFVGLVVLLAVLALRWSRRPPIAADLRRADDAEATMPTADEIWERVSEAFDQTRPPGP